MIKSKQCVSFLRGDIRASGPVTMLLPRIAAISNSRFWWPEVRGTRMSSLSIHWVGWVVESKHHPVDGLSPRRRNCLVLLLGPWGLEVFHHYSIDLIQSRLSSLCPATNEWSNEKDRGKDHRIVINVLLIRHCDWSMLLHEEWRIWRVGWWGVWLG